MERETKGGFAAHAKDQASALRERMGNKRSGNDMKIISVTSGKGGVGKSSITVNLAIALSRMGLRVLVVDADFGLANVDIMLGVTARYNLSHVLRGERSMQEIIQEGHEGVRFISGGSGVTELLKMNEAKLGRVMGNLMRLSDPADMILVDTGAGINDNILEVILSSTQTIVVTTPEPTAVMDAYALIKTIIQREPAHYIQIVMNKGETRRELENVTRGFSDVIEKNLEVHVETLGYVAYDSEVPKSIKRQIPVMISHPDGAAAQDIGNLAKVLLRIPCEPARAGRFSGLFSRLFGGSEG